MTESYEIQELAWIILSVTKKNIVPQINLQPHLLMMAVYVCYVCLKEDEFKYKRNKH